MLLIIVKLDLFLKEKNKAKQYFVLIICRLIRMGSKTLGKKAAPAEFLCYKY